MYENRADGLGSVRSGGVDVDFSRWGLLMIEACCAKSCHYVTTPPARTYMSNFSAGQQHSVADVERGCGC